MISDGYGAYAELNTFPEPWANRKQRGIFSSGADADKQTRHKGHSSPISLLLYWAASFHTNVMKITFIFVWVNYYIFFWNSDTVAVCCFVFVSLNSHFLFSECRGGGRTVGGFLVSAWFMIPQRLALKENWQISATIEVNDFFHLFNWLFSASVLWAHTRWLSNTKMHSCASVALEEATDPMLNLKHLKRDSDEMRIK